MTAPDPGTDYRFFENRSALVLSGGGARAAYQAHRQSPNRRVAPVLPAQRPSWRERATAAAWWLAVALAGELVASGEPEPCSCCHSPGEAIENAKKD